MTVFEVEIALSTALATESASVENGALSMPFVIFVVTNPGRTTNTETPDPTNS